VQVAARHVRDPDGRDDECERDVEQPGPGATVVAPRRPVIGRAGDAAVTRAADLKIASRADDGGAGRP
jgi:hypothetical protein